MKIYHNISTIFRDARPCFVSDGVPVKLIYRAVFYARSDNQPVYSFQFSVCLILRRKILQLKCFPTMSKRKLPNLHFRMPVTFGPYPGPRQSFYGYRRNGAISTNVEAYITFKTTKSSLVNLLPKNFTFQMPGPDAYVTIAPKRLDKLEWLGGRGYNLYSYYIHGIKYISENGNSYNGTFLPVLWEDMADPIISGREELGFPKLFAELDIQHTANSFSMRASWQGTEFSQFLLQNLKELTDDGGVPRLSPKEAGTDDGILLYRYIPSIGRPGYADTEYPVFVSFAEEGKIQQATVVRRFTASTGKFNWIPSTWENLPTLNHIIIQLLKVQNLEILRCGLIEKEGVPDFSSVTRI